MLVNTGHKGESIETNLSAHNDVKTKFNNVENFINSTKIFSGIGSGNN